jgi:hypothetical protein
MNLDQLPLSASAPHIVTNNIPRNLIYGYELTDNEKIDFDYIDNENIDTENFIKYKGAIYHTGDMMAINARELFPLGFNEWHAYESQSFFNGVLFKFSDDGETVVCGRYYS